MTLPEKTETRLRLMITLLRHFHKYMTQLGEYDSKNFSNGVTRTDEATLDDFAFWLLHQGD